MNFITSEYWDVGRRESNEDSLLVAHVDTKVGQIVLGAVADGIGGLSEGEVASGHVLEKISSCFYENIASLIVAGKKRSLIERSLLRCLYEAGCELRAYGGDKGISLGTTLSLILIYDKEYIMVHIGDSGIFECVRNSIRMITNAHRLAGGRVCKCLGSFSYMEPDVDYGKITPGTGFLLATDGYYRGMTMDENFWNPKNMVSEHIISKRLTEMGQVVLKTQKDNAGAIYINCI